MKQDFDYTEFIERYLQGEMAPDEKVWFEKEIEGNLSLRDEINLRRKVNSVLTDKDMIELKVQLDKIHQEIFEATEKGKGAIRKIYRKVYFTAGTLTVFVLMFSFYLSNRNYSNEKLVELYYQPIKASVSVRAADPSGDKLSKAMVLYNAQRYEEAISAFEKILTEDKTKVGVNLYSGISHMEMEKYDLANERFQRVIEGEPNPFVESAYWYLGMCYLMTNNREKAAEKFQLLTDSEGFYHQQAKKILKRIK